MIMSRSSEILRQHSQGELPLSSVWIMVVHFSSSVFSTGIAQETSNCKECKKSNSSSQTNQYPWALKWILAVFQIINIDHLACNRDLNYKQLYWKLSSLYRILGLRKKKLTWQWLGVPRKINWGSILPPPLFHYILQICQLISYEINVSLPLYYNTTSYRFNLIFAYTHHNPDIIW